MVPLELAVADALENWTLPKSAKDVSEQLKKLHSSGRSTTHSAEDCAAPENPMFVEYDQAFWESETASVQVVPDTETEAEIVSPGDTGYVDGESSTW